MALNATASSGNELGFGMEFYLIDNFTQVAQKIQQSMNSLYGAASAHQKTFSKIQQGYSNVFNGFSNIGASVALMLPFKKAIDASGGFEALLIQFETIIGSREKALQLFEGIKIDALKFPSLGVDDLAFANAKIIKVASDAVTARDKINDLAMTFQAFGGDKAAFKRIAINMGEIRSYGYADKKDLRQFTTANIPIYDMLQKYAGINAFKQKATYEDITKALKGFAAAHNNTEKVMNSVRGQSAALKENIHFIFASLGDSIKDTYVSVMKYLNGILTTIREFLQTDTGKFTTKLTFMVLGVNALGFGLSGIYKSLYGLRLIGGSLLSIFPTLFSTISKLLRGSTLFGAEIAMSAILKKVSMVLSIVTLINSNSGLLVAIGVGIGAAFGWIGLAIAGLTMIVRAFSEWNRYSNGTIKNLQGISGEFARFGGILQGVWEIMNNLTNDGWTMNAALVKKLDNAGILDTVQAVGTWIIRIREFFKGIFDGFVEFASVGWNMIKAVLNNFDSMFNKPEGTLAAIVGSMETWLQAGQLLGRILGFAFTALATIASIILAAIGAIIKLISELINFIGYLVGKFYDLMNASKAFGESIINTINSVFTWFSSGEWYNWGVNAINSFFEGFKSIGDRISTWFSSQLSFGGVPQYEGSNQYSYTPFDYMRANNQDADFIRNYQLGAMSSANTQQPTPTPSVQHIFLQVDGKTLAEVVNGENGFDNARYGIS